MNGFRIGILVVFVIGCVERSSPTAPSEAVARQRVPIPPPLRVRVLTFSTQPTPSFAAQRIAPAVVVTAKLPTGRTDEGFIGNVTLSLVGGSDSSALEGQTTAPAIAGVATFTDLRISTVGGNYTLRATANGANSGTSSSFDVATMPRIVFSLCFEWGFDNTTLIDYCAAGGLSTSAFDGSETSLAVKRDSEFWDPAWSPDGKQIAMAGYRDCPPPWNCVYDLWVMNADGSGLTSLTNGKYRNAGGAAWSPDGQRIAFAAAPQSAPGDGGDDRRLYAMNRDGSGAAPLGELHGGGPAWSPDGHRIAFSGSSDDRHHVIFVANADGSNPVPLSMSDARNSNDFAPSWSPDGRRIAFTRAWTHADGSGSCQVFVMNADGSNPVQLTHDSFCALNAAWAPDGRKIAFNGGDGQGRFGLMLMNPDGSGAVLMRRYEGSGSRVAWAPR